MVIRCPQQMSADAKQNVHLPALSSLAPIRQTRGMNTSRYRGYRFPRELIGHAVWLYYRFTLNFRDVEDLVAERGVYPPNAGFRFSIADDLEVLRQKRTQLVSVLIWVLEEPFAGLPEFAERVVVGVVEDLFLEELPKTLDQVEIR